MEKGITSEILKELESYIQDNIWLEHFKKVKIQEGWIDFEREISKAVQIIESDI